MLPLVTCLCLTRNRSEWLPKAIACFAAQTYEQRELLIVADGDDVTAIVAALPAGSPVRLACVGATLSIGAKRNYGCGLANGELIAHWDDDDYSAPGRLVDQVERLLSCGRAVTGYEPMKFTDGASWWEYTSEVPRGSYVVGTSLMYRRDWWAQHPFPDCHVGEDSAFVAQAFAAGQLCRAEAGDLMYATIHEGNTSQRLTAGANWRRL